MNEVILGKDITFEVIVPVIVVGGGASGLIAALAAHDRGAHVIVLERDPNPSGSTALSSGLIPACNTRWQRAINISDSDLLFMNDINKKSKYEADKKLVERVCSVSAQVLHWLADNHEQEFVVLNNFLYPGHSVHRMHAHPKRTGKALIEGLLDAVKKAGIEVITSAHVTDVYASDESNIQGVRINRPDGSTEDIGCKSLILACNGYGGNSSMISNYIPEMKDALYFGHKGNQGDAINWGIKLGASIKHMGAYQGHGSVATPHGALITWAIMMEGGVQLNTLGERFSNEHQGYSEQSINVLEQPERVVWNIFDGRLHELGCEFEDYRKANESGAIKIFHSLDALANSIGAPIKTVSATLKDLELYKKGFKTCPFGRNFSETPSLEGPPYYGVKVTGALFHTQGGLSINKDGRVLRKNGTNFPNLFAVGGSAVGVSGGSVEGYLSGNGLLTAVAMGFVAGKSAACLVAGPQR